MVAERWEAADPDALVRAECATVRDRLDERIAHRCGRVEVRARVRRYVMGLLERLDRTNGWPLAEVSGEGGPQDRRASSACSPRPSGTPRPCATTCAALWSSTGGTGPAAAAC